MKKLNNMIFVSTFISTLALFLMFFFNNAQAFKPTSRIAVKAIKEAVQTNIHQALKPALTIKSRYSKSMISVKYSNNGQYFVTLSNNGSGQLWNNQTGQKIQNIRVSQDSIMSLAFSINSTSILSGGQKGMLYFWNINKNMIVNSFRAHSDLISSLIEIPHQGWLSASYDGSIKLWDIHSKTLKQTFAANGGAVFSIAVNKRGDRLVSGHDDGKIRVWNLLTSQKIITIDGGGGKVYSLALSSDDVVAAGLESGEVRLWNFITGRKISSEKRHDASVIAVAISNDSTYLVTGGEDNSVKISLLGKEVDTVLYGHEGTINSICFTGNDDFFLTASADKTVRLWSWKKEKELARLIVMLDGWAVITPEGFFDGTLDGETEDRLQYIMWNVGDMSFGIDGFMEKYYEPSLLGQILDGRSIFKEKPVAENISEGFQLPPLMKISAASLSESNKTKINNRILVIVEAVDQGGGVDEIRLYHNDKAVSDMYIKSSIRQEDKEKRQVKKYELDLVDGNNSFMAVGFSKNRIESIPVKTSTEYSLPLEHVETKLHLVSIGINKYKNPAFDLNFAVTDAKGVLQGITENQSKVFDVYNYYELYDGEANKSAILDVFNSLTNLPPQDTVILYLAGHGNIYNNQWYFIPYDLYNPNNYDNLVKKGISSLQLQNMITDIGARKVVLLIDCCKAGAVMNVFHDQKVFAILSRRAGIHIGAAATNEQKAIELKDLKHGIFTYAFLNGVSGEADNKPTDGNITIKEILNYIKAKMPELVKKHATPHQDPVINSIGMDFHIASPKQDI